MVCKCLTSNIKCLENAAAIGQKSGFQDESRQEGTIPKRGFSRTRDQFYKICMPSQTRRLRLFFQKRKNSLNLFLQKYPKIRKCQFSNRVPIRLIKSQQYLLIIITIYFFVTEAQKSSKNKNNHPQLKNFTGSYIKKAYIISRQQQEGFVPVLLS